MIKPKLADLPAVNTKYEAGDRIIVRTDRFLTSQQTAKIRKMLAKYAGGEVRPLFVPCSHVRIDLEMVDGRRVALGDRVGEPGTPKLGTMMLDVKQVDLFEVSVIHVFLHHGSLPFLTTVREWAAQDAEVREWVIV